MPWAVQPHVKSIDIHPMQVPDVSAVLHTSDFPCVKANHSVPDTEWRDKNQDLPPQHYSGRPVPVMGYNRKDGFLDLMFPDFTFYGNEYSQITGGSSWEPHLGTSPWEPHSFPSTSEARSDCRA